MKLDIFTVLGNITKGNVDYIDSLSDEEVKAFQAYVVQLWLKGANNYHAERMVLMNEVSNPYVFSLGRHPKLIYKLFCVAHGFNDGARFTFNRKRGKTANRSLSVVMNAYDYTQQKAQEALSILTNDDLLALAKDLGYDQKEMRELEKEIDHGSITNR